MMWARIKDAAIGAGLEPWLRPVVDTLRGQEPEPDDIATRDLISRLARDAVCVDIGCHKGKFLDPMRRAAPHGRFFAFEPVPYLCKLLISKYRADARVQVFNMALSSSCGTSALYINEVDMGLSGLSDRPGREGMDRDRLRRIDVPVNTLDGVLGSQHVDFIKIDVEGAEFDVLQGARQIMIRSRPLILFEFGLGGADYFGVDAGKMYDLFPALDYAIYTVPDHVRGRDALTAAAFSGLFTLNATYNFVAAPRH
jgi:FkbM family methyltransferase